MKYVIVGDIHGKVHEVQRALEKEGIKIFVGDFIDSFDRSVEDHDKCFELVLDACEKGEAKCIYGNHELSYLKDGHQSSGWKYEHAVLVKQKYQAQIRKHFKSHIFLEPDFLVTHAGLTRQHWLNHNLTLERLPLWLADGWFADRTHPVHHVGAFRGGMSSAGGIFWCDFNHEFVPIPELTQVFGHTRGNGIRRRENSFCIDCLDYRHTFLEIEL